MTVWLVQNIQAVQRCVKFLMAEKPSRVLAGNEENVLFPEKINLPYGARGEPVTRVFCIFPSMKQRPNL
jgi:hypothetical protein